MRVRSRRRRAAEPVVAFTANAFAEDRDACLAAGLTDWLAKPVLAGSVSAALERRVPGAGSVRPARDSRV